MNREYSVIFRGVIRVVLRKRCSENIPYICRRIPMMKCDFNKIILQLYWNHTSAWISSCKFAACFQKTFLWEHVWRAASVKCYCSVNFIRSNLQVAQNGRFVMKPKYLGDGTPWCPPEERFWILVSLKAWKMNSPGPFAHPSHPYRVEFFIVFSRAFVNTYVTYH